MNDEIDYKNNPLHGLSLKNLVVELVDHYGFEILYAYINLNCFKTNPSVASCVKFLKKTEWAREKVEAFYLYEFKNLPKASSEQFLLSPRDRIIPADQSPAAPKELSLEDAERLHEKRLAKAAAFNKGTGQQRSNPSGGKGAHRNTYSSDRDRGKSKPSSEENADPWANARTKFKQ